MSRIRGRGRHRQRWAPRVALALLAVLAVAALALATAAREPRLPWVRAAASRSAAAGPKNLPLSPPPRLPGGLLYSTANALMLARLGDASTRTFQQFPSTTLVASPAVSPDGSRVAFQHFVSASAGAPAGGAQIYVAELSGGAPRVLVAPDAPGESVGEPAWSADGTALYVARHASDGARVERVELGTGTRSVVAQDAGSPTLSRDGRWLAYLSPLSGSRPPTLWLASPDGSSARELVPGVFQQLNSPQFAPSSQQIVFAAAGRPTQFGAATPPRQAHALDLLRPRTAYAHGMLADLWLAPVTGGTPVRIADVGEDAPMPAWSPDGQWVAFSGENGIYLCEVATRRTLRIAQTLAAGLTWLP